MKVAILSESKADEEALRILIDAVLGVATLSIAPPRLETRRGISNVEKLLPAILCHVYYRTDADGFALVVDSNGSPLHRPEHDSPGGANPECRLCELRRVIAITQRRLKPVAGRAHLHTAVGLACPALEAWYLCGRDPHATEAAWARELDAGTQARPYVQKLKRAVYGTDRPSLPMEIDAAIRETQRLAANLGELEGHFPMGFGAFAAELRAWRAGS